MRVYATVLFAENESLTETAELLGVERHGLSAKIDREFLARLRRAR